MSKSQRDKGRRGQTEAQKLLVEYGYAVDPITCGVKREDMIATSGGKSWCVEVKNHKLIDIMKFRRQAREQAKERKLPWMLMVKIPGSSYWLIERKNGTSRIWRRGNNG